MLKRLLAKWLPSDQASPPAPPHTQAASREMPLPEVVRDIRRPLHENNQAKPACNCQTIVTETNEIDFCCTLLNQTIETHYDFVKELREILGGKIPEAYSPDIIGADDRCKLGKWLFNEAKSLEKYPAYAEVIQAHLAFHVCAAEIVRVHQKEEFALAIKMLNHDLKALSQQLEASLRQLHQQAQASKCA